MRKPVVPSLGLVLFLTVGGCASAAQQKPQEPSTPAPGYEMREEGERAFGTVTSVGVDRFEIKKMDGSTQTVMVNDQTRYREGQKDIQLEDLKAGDRVFVRGRTDSDKTFIAAIVRRLTEEEIQRFQNAGERAFGEIISIDKNQIKIRNPRQGERTIVVNDQTQFTKQGQPISLKDLKVGDRIMALGKESQGQFLATRVFTGAFRGQEYQRRNPEP